MAENARIEELFQRLGDVMQGGLDEPSPPSAAPEETEEASGLFARLESLLQRGRGTEGFGPSLVPEAGFGMGLANFPLEEAFHLRELPPEDMERLSEAGMGQGILEGTPIQALQARIERLVHDPAFRQRVGQATQRRVGTTAAIGGAMLAGPLAASTSLPLKGAEAVAGMAGEAARQGLMGERDPVGLVAAGALPSVFRGVFRSIRAVGTATKAGVKMLPGAAAGLTEEAAQKGTELINALRPKDLRSLSRLAHSFDKMRVPLENFLKNAQALESKAATLAPDIQPRQALRLSRQITKLMQDIDDNALPLGQLRDNLSGIGEELGRFRRAQGDRSGLVRGVTRNLNALRKMYSVVLKDLDALPQPVPPSLRAYREALRTDFATTTLERIIERGTDYRAVDGLLTLKPRQIARAWRTLKKSPEIQVSFSRAQRAQIDEFMDELLQLPPLPRPSGTTAGSAADFVRGGGVGGIVAGATGDPATGAFAGGVALLGPRVIAWAMMKESGRRALARMLAMQGYSVRPEQIQALAAASRLALTPGAQGEAQPAQSIEPPPQGLFP